MQDARVAWIAFLAAVAGGVSTTSFMAGMPWHPWNGVLIMGTALVAILVLTFETR